MLTLELKRVKLSGDYVDCWDLCFDPEQGRFFILHSATSNGEEIFSRKISTTFERALVAENLKQNGFVEFKKKE